MKRSAGLQRGAPLSRGAGLSRTSPLSSGESLNRHSAPPRTNHLRKAPTGRERGAGTGKARPARDLTQAIRELVYERDDHACVRCGRGLIAGNRSVQHRDARGMGSANPNPHALSNLIAVCGVLSTDPDGCHHHIERWRLNAQAGGWSVPMGQAPAAWPVRYSEHHGGGMWLLDDDGDRIRVS